MITVGQYFEKIENVDTETISNKAFNRQAWPHFYHWREVEACAREVVAAHPNLEFFGDKTLGMLMCWTMNLYRQKYGENLPSGWYATAKQLMAAAPQSSVAAHANVSTEELVRQDELARKVLADGEKECPVCACFPEARSSHPHR